MNPHEPLVRITIHGPRGGHAATNWLVEARDARGAVPLYVSAPQDVALAALAEYVESLHAVETAPPRLLPWW